MVRTAAAAIAALTLAVGAAHAAPIVVFNTGVNAAGVPLPSQTVGDPHYSLISAPGRSTTTIKVLRASSRYPIPPWIGNNTVSAWIAPDVADGFGPGGVGNAYDYDYRTTFSLAGFIATTATITGEWAADNEGVNILINGVSTGQTTGGGTKGYRSFTAFSISSGFLPGLNTLDFIVHNDAGPGANPTGLRVQLAGTARVPEPATLAILGAGLLTLGLVRRRRS